MKKILIFLFFNLFLIGCSEKEQKKDTKPYKSKYDVFGTERLKKLDQELNTDPFLILTLSYTHIISSLDVCDIMKEAFKDNSKNIIKDIKVSIDIGCDFHKEIYDKYLINFQDINSNNYKNYYYFNYKKEDTESDFGNYLGIFKNLSSCNEVKDKFLNAEIGYVSRCKNIDSRPIK